MTKTISKKRILSLALVVVMAFSVFAISASALTPDEEYTPVLSVASPVVTHTFDFFDEPAIIGTDENELTTITLHLKDPVYITVTMGGSTLFDGDGNVVAVIPASAGFTVDYDELTHTVIITITDAGLAATDVEDFSISLTFDIENMDTPSGHGSYTATLTLV
jgi:hypothetical protein